MDGQRVGGVALLHPAGDAVGVVLVRVAVFGGKRPAPERRVNFGYDGTARWRGPAVEGPEMHARTKLLPQVTQPRQSGVGGLGHASLNIEVKDGLRAAPFLGHPPPTGITGARGPIAMRAVPDEIDIEVIAIGRPVVLEVIEELRPVGRDAVDLEVAQRKGKRVVDTDKRGRAVAQFGCEPFGDAAAGPILTRAGWRWNFGGRLRGRGRVEAQASQATRGRLRAGIVDAEVAFKLRHGWSGPACDFGDEGGEEVRGGGAGGGELRFQRVHQGHQLLHFGHDPALFAEGWEWNFRSSIRPHGEMTMSRRCNLKSILIQVMQD